MPLPEITHLQFLILALLLDGELSGRKLREGLAEAGHRKSAPAFYQFMARLEDAELVEGRYDQKVIDGQIIKERFYTLTGAGERAWADVRDFYMAHGRLGLRGA
jgi:DNA-binding PadR family transcriptional regulator